MVANKHTTLDVGIHLGQDAVADTHQSKFTSWVNIKGSGGTCTIWCVSAKQAERIAAAVNKKDEACG